MIANTVQKLSLFENLPKLVKTKLGQKSSEKLCMDWFLSAWDTDTNDISLSHESLSI